MRRELAFLCLLIAPLCGERLFAQPPPGTVLWTYDVGSTILSPASSPAVGLDGTVYFGASTSLYAVTNSGSYGSNKWTFAAIIAGPPTVGLDGTIYFGDDSQSVNLHALRPNGSEKWVLPLQPEFQYQIKFRSSPSLGPDGTVYFAAGGRLYAVSASGSNKWEHVIDNASMSDPLSPSIGPDGTIYVGSTWNRTLYAINPDGTERWSAGLAAASGESVAIGGDSTIYIAAGPLYAFSSIGTNLWQSQSGPFDGSPAIAPGGALLVSGYQSHNLSNLRPGGQLAWQGPTGGASSLPSTGPAIGGTGAVYYCVSNSLWALSATGDVQWTLDAPGDPGPGGYFAVTSPAIGPNGIIYVTLGTKLYAVAGTSGTSGSLWPMYKQNPRHTGKVEKPSLQQPKKRADANFQFELYAQIDQTQTVQTSVDFVTWTDLTNIAITNVPMDVVDLSASNFTARFYRTLSQ